MADIRAQLTRVREAANDIAGNATDRLRETRESASEAYVTSRERAEVVYADARDRTQKAATRANQIIQDHPVTAVAGAVAVGAVLAWMFPKSRKMMKTIPALAVTAGSRVLEAAAAARATTADNADSAKDNATSALLTARDNASEAFHAAKENAGEALQAARDNAAQFAAHARESASAADLPGKASRLADDAIALIAAKADAFSDALKARLPKR
ncbi:protein of unknown function [Sphingobium faniae]|nr:protein of unknown function [Sphingobium faniae]